MTTPASKRTTDIAALLQSFEATRRALIDAAQAVTPELRDVPFVGDWDLKDVIAHTIGWDRTNVEALPDFAAGRLPAFFADYDDDWAAWNAALVARYRVEDWETLLASLREATAVFVAALVALGDDALDNETLWGRRRISLRGMLRAVDRDEREHVRQIRDFVSHHAR